MIKTCFVPIALWFIAVSVSAQSGAFRMPAEWEPHEAVWLGWEEEDTTFHPVALQMVAGLMPNVRVKIAVRSDSLRRAAAAWLQQNGIDTSRLRFYTIPGERYWIRDHGAPFLVNDRGGLAVADFVWNLYGYEGWVRQYFEGNEDSVRVRMKRDFNPETGRVDSMMAVIEGAAIVKSPLVIEGGAIETNGKGTLIACEAVMRQRNPRLSLTQMEAMLKETLGIRKVIWVKQGLLEDEHMRQLHFGKYATWGTGGHTDEFVRFVSETTVLLAWVEEKERKLHPFNEENSRRMQENLRLLQAATTADGKKLTIINVPLPDIIQYPMLVKDSLDKDDWVNTMPRRFLPQQRPRVGDTLFNVAASSYLNYFLSNGVVLLPTYTAQGSSPAKEKRVSEILRKLYPARKQVWIECMALNFQGGGIHCSTQQQPERKR